MHRAVYEAYISQSMDGAHTSQGMYYSIDVSTFLYRQKAKETKSFVAKERAGFG